MRRRRSAEGAQRGPRPGGRAAGRVADRRAPERAPVLGEQLDDRLRLGHAQLDGRVAGWRLRSAQRQWMGPLVGSAGRGPSQPDGRAHAGRQVPWPAQDLVRDDALHQLIEA